MSFPRNTIVALLLLTGCASSISIPENEYGLEVVADPELQARLIAANPSHELVELEEILENAKFDVRYATENNFMGRVLYDEANPLLRRPAAAALAAAERELAQQGIGIVIFDAYRPYTVTKMMWEPYKDPDYVADPAYGSRHNRGAAVDLTLYDLATGQPLDMGTDYDDFRPLAAHGAEGLSDEVVRNRTLLKTVMARHGFDPLASEWWHYDFRGWREFPLMDL